MSLDKLKYGEPILFGLVVFIFKEGIIMKYSTKKLATLAILLALCVIGANIKILGSIALDSFPAFIGAIILGPAAGAF